MSCVGMAEEFVNTLEELDLSAEMADEPVPYDEVQALDVLQVDKFMQSLPAVTSQGKLDPILAVLYQTVRDFNKETLSDIPSCLAALRDFDFLITCAHRIEKQSYKRIDGLEALLQDLGCSARHRPRGSNFTYGLFNPEDQRMRTFTGRTEERSFIHAVQRGTRYLDNSLLVLEKLASTMVTSCQFELLAQELVFQFESMIPAVVDVLRTVPPEVFSLKIVPFFSPLDIGGEMVPGITGAQIQNVVIDYIFFGMDIDDSDYLSYVQTNLAAMLPFHIRVLRRTTDQLHGTSLLSKVQRDVACNGAVDRDQATRSLMTVQHYLRRVLSFRHVHRKLASTNLPMRAQHRGSGGYGLDFLDYLINQTQEASRRVERMRLELL